jgi:V/A-type H+-transporting ATPase subunit I
MVSGLTAILFFTDVRPVDHWTDGLKRLLAGLLSLTNVTKLFGDVLSYLRLFALGLASASLALTFNQLAAQVADALPGLGFFFSLLILLLGHALNLALSLMSGVVHGLRLNFIEFFNWGMSEEGYPFKAFIKKETQNG